ncbi:hypothetical protein HPSD74_0128 [Glaesserella parasuis D74]|nr:hypothetical protein HPSD74_0128 [Glaesserella parasuis D74]
MKICKQKSKMLLNCEINHINPHRLLKIKSQLFYKQSREVIF